MMLQPSITTLMVITGLPATGKSTVASQLQKHLRWPLLAKDVIKESLFDSLGWQDRAWSRRLSDASYEVLFSLLQSCVASGVNVIAEANFRIDAHAARFAALRQIAPLRLIQVLCVTDGEVLQQRFLQRASAGQRHPGHVDLASFAELAPQLANGADQRLPNADEVIEWDTTIANRDPQPLFVQLANALR